MNDRRAALERPNDPFDDDFVFDDRHRLGRLWRGGGADHRAWDFAAHSDCRCVWGRVGAACQLVGGPADRLRTSGELLDDQPFFQPVTGIKQDTVPDARF